MANIQVEAAAQRAGKPLAVYGSTSANNIIRLGFAIAGAAPCVVCIHLAALCHDGGRAAAADAAIPAHSTPPSCLPRLPLAQPCGT